MTDLLRDRYEPLEVVGQGGEGRVLKAVDRQHDRLVALKVRTVRSGVDRDLLLTEAGTLLGITPHPHLPLVREDFFEGDHYVIAMDWIEGTDLAQLTRAGGRPGLAPSTVLGWLADAAAALTHLHTQERPVVHGDVKPANLVLTAGGRVVLVDFGLSSAPDSLRRRGGTAGFAAPELAAGEEPSRASDIYSLAATAFALLTGEAPSGVRPAWEGIDPEQAAQLEDAIRAGLATDPSRRPVTPGALVERLRAGWGSSLPTGVLTFCFTDIEGSTALWDADPAAMARALLRHEQVVADVMERNGGRCLQSMGEGDSTVSVFPAAAAAVTGAIDLQRTLAGEPGPGEAGRPLRVRIGLHTGEAAPRAGSYMGTTLNATARVRALADGGQIFLSGATATLVEPGLPAGASLVDLGPHRLRGLRETEPVFALSAPGIDAPPAVSSCPYPGLPAFQRGDAERFFGRADVVAELADRLRRTSFVAVVGASGSGKSSVLRAGLLAEGQGGAVITPGASPEPLAEGAELIVVDQFEEVFTLCDDLARRTRFLDSVVGRTGPVAVGLRADFYGRCTEHPALARALAGQHVLLGPLDDDELRQAITGPARVAGLQIEPGLVDVLVEEILGEPGSLPLLSHALRATWEHRDGRLLTLDAYRATGGVRAAVATTAEDVYGSLAPAEQQLARRTFLSLTEPGEGTEDSRRRATLAELTPVGGEDRIGALLDAMAEARLVSVGEGTAEVAHEALIRHWPRLRSWLDEDRDGLRLHRHLSGAATEWEASGRDPGELYRGPRLVAALEWSERSEDTSALETAFLDAGEAEQDREQRARARSNRRLRALLAAAGVALVVALVAGSIAFFARQRAEESRDRADVARVAAVSRGVVERQPDLGLLLAAAAFDLEDTADTRGTLLSALEAHPLLDGLLYGAESGLEAAVFSPDGATLATPTSDGTGTILWDVASGDRLDVLRDEPGISLDAAISPDGRWLVVPSIRGDESRYFGTLEVWDLESRQLETVVDSPAGTLTTASFSADGSRLFTHGGFSDELAQEMIVEWDTASWQPVGAPWVLAEEYLGDEGFVVSGDGGLAAVPLPDGSVGVWRTTDRSMVGSPIRVSGEVRELSFAPDGSVLAISTDGGGVFLVDPLSGAVEGPPLTVPGSTATSLEFDPDGFFLAVGRLDGRTQLYDVGSGEPLGPALAASAAEVSDVTFGGDSLLVTTSLDRTAALWRLDGGRSIGVDPPDQEAAVTEAVFTADGTRLLTAALNGTVAVRAAGTGEVEVVVAVPGEALSVAVDPSGRRLAAAGTEGVVVLADLDGGNRVEVDFGPSVPQQVAFAPDGESVAVALDDTGGDPTAGGPGTGGGVRFVDPTSGAAEGPSVGPEQDPEQAALGLGYVPGGDLVAVVHVNNRVRFYSVTTGREEGDLIENPDAPFTSLAFSPDGTRIALGISSGAVRQYDLETREPTGQALDGDPSGVFGVAYSPDGTTLAGTSLGFSTTQLWDADSGAALGTRLTGGRVPYSYNTFEVNRFMGSRPSFSPDGRSLVTPGFPGATVIWDLDPDRWLSAACATAGRDLSDEEWDRYLPGRPHRAVCGGA